MTDEFEYTTKPWQRSQSSWATTIPSEILAIKSAPTGDNARVKWSINEDTGAVEVRFVEESSDD
ncbi:hypothetical protein [Halorussus pelagicus]|uniref:hypothetical protein n=1 Tax=Halorussus pelagicus TaxID=2505977 RepID=UPI000FFB27C6|nr:hypothetical protein [Halorussus pelagicus]